MTTRHELEAICDLLAGVLNVDPEFVMIDGDRISLRARDAERLARRVFDNLVEHVPDVPVRQRDGRPSR